MIKIDKAPFFGACVCACECMHSTPPTPKKLNVFNFNGAFFLSLDEMDFFYSYDYYFGNRYYFFKRKERKPNQIKYKPLGSIMALGFMSQSRSEPNFDRWKFVIPGYISFTEMLFESNFIKDARHWYNAALFCVTAFI